MGVEERVVLLNEEGIVIGSTSKALVHTENTALHLAFSCYLFNDAGEILLTRRALSKRTWPGVWTNSFCGHPSPEEEIVDAIVRRGQEELGASISEVKVVLPDFRYRAIDASGIVENEICPVHVAHLIGELAPCADEVMEFAWVEPRQLLTAAENAPFAFSPWLIMQIPQLVSAQSHIFAVPR